ncbi:MAG: hypothetical protein PF482_07970 [Desulfobacteraceae bacterium]|nr:hypothetical protein [Desulfobacteraceae bacterium]
MTENLKNYRRKILSNIESRDPKTQGFDAGPDPDRKNKLPKLRQPVTYSQVRKEGGE